MLPLRRHPVGSRMCSGQRFHPLVNSTATFISPYHGRDASSAFFILDLRLLLQLGPQYDAPPPCTFDPVRPVCEPGQHTAGAQLACRSNNALGHLEPCGASLAPPVPFSGPCPGKLGDLEYWMFKRGSALFSLFR
jgi:hypothetical protein